MKSPLLFVASMALVVGRLFAGDLVVAGYNLENYDPVDTGNMPMKTKTPEAVDAEIKIIKEINPDVLGVCEMGPAVQFEDFKKRLADAGLGYTDFEYVQAADPDRHLALVSRYPIVARNSLADLSYDINGSRDKVRRGFLDVTVKVNEQTTVRLIGVHLKSRLAGKEDDSLVRRNEAHLLRQHVDEILEADPKANLVVYGDFNETKEQASIHEIAGRRGAPDYLTELRLADNCGDRWTHYWNVDDVYSRIDYIFVNRALSRFVARDKSYIYRSPAWNEASDHRPVVATLHFPH